MLKQFFVVTDGGNATVTRSGYGYTIEATATVAGVPCRTVVEVQKNEAGFRGRQWETTPAVWDGQHATLRQAAQETIAVTVLRAAFTAGLREVAERTA